VGTTSIQKKMTVLANIRLSELVPVKGPRRDTMAGGVAICRFFAAAGAGKGDGIVAFGRGDAKSGVFPFSLDAQTWRRAHALPRHPNHPPRPPQDAVASVCHRRTVAVLSPRSRNWTPASHREKKERGEELAPATEATTAGKGSRHRRRGSFEISAEGEGGRGAPATSAGSRRGKARG
jgi:hypothetical protein